MPDNKQPYISIDIETTGLNPETCQVLEVGAIIDDWRDDPYTLPKFRAILKHDSIFGEPFAIQMNAALIKLIATIPAVKGEMAEPEISPLDPVNCMFAPHEVTGRFKHFLQKNGISLDVGFQPAGKNFASFDKPFLELCVPRWKRDVKIKHRTIDPGNLYWKPGVEYIPDSKACKERAGIPGIVAHTAVEDALDVILEIREYKRNLERTQRNLANFGNYVEAFGYLQASLHPSLHVADEPMTMARDIVAHLKEGQPGDN